MRLPRKLSLYLTAFELKTKRARQARNWNVCLYTKKLKCIYYKNTFCLMEKRKGN